MAAMETTDKNTTVPPDEDSEYIKGLPSLVRERIDEARAADYEDGDSIVLLHGMERAMIGTVENAAGKIVAVYEEELCIRCLMEDMSKPEDAGDDWGEDDAYTDALEFYEYNTVRALPYIGDSAPIIIRGFDVDSDRWEAFKNAAGN